MLLFRVCSIYSAGITIAATVVLCVVALVAPWWSPGALAPDVTKDAEPIPGGAPAAKSAPNSEITLWGNVGCGGNESMANICSMGYEAPAIQGCLRDWRASEFETGGEWQPPPPPITTTTVLPTLDPNRPTTTTGLPPAFACASGGTSCVHRALTTEDPNRWGTAAQEAGEGQRYGDSRINIVEGSTVTAEDPAKVPSTSSQPLTTAMPPMPSQAPIGEKPGSDEGPAEPTSAPSTGFFQSVAGDNFQPKASTTEPLASVRDPSVKPKVSTTESPASLPGIEQVLALCPLARDEKTSRIFVCQLHSQCDNMAQARNAVIAAAASAGLSGLLVALFGAGGGGVGPKGQGLPTKHVLGFLSAALAVGSALCSALGLSLAAGLDLPHDMNGPGMASAVAAIFVALLAAIFAAVASLLALLYPGGPPQSTEVVVKTNHEIDLEAERHAAEEEYPGLKQRPARTLAVRLAWEPPLPLEGLADVEQVGHTAGATTTPFSLAVALETPPPDPVVVDMPPEPEASPEAEPASPAAATVTDHRLRNFFSGEGAVYAHRYYASLNRVAVQQQASVEATPQPQEVAPSPSELNDAGWDTANSPRSGEVYYFNRETGAVQWEPPFLMPATVPHVGCDDGDELEFPGSPMSSVHSCGSWQAQTWTAGRGSRFSMNLASTASGPWLPSEPSSPTSPMSPGGLAPELAAAIPPEGMSLRDACAAGVFTPGSPTWAKRVSKTTGAVHYVRQGRRYGSEASTQAPPSPIRRRGDVASLRSSMSRTSTDFFHGDAMSMTRSRTSTGFFPGSP